VSVRRVSSGGPGESAVGDSRAVAAGHHVFVTSTVDGAVTHVGDAYAQTVRPGVGAR